MVEEDPPETSDGTDTKIKEKRTRLRTSSKVQHSMVPLLETTS